MIKHYFADYYLEASDVEINVASGSIRYLSSNTLENWKVTVIDTGIETMTGGGIKRAAHHIGKRHSA
jgi:glucose-1-phosphate cytidylyltransferase